MSIDLPSTALEIIERSKTDVQRDFPGSNPFLENSVLGALVTSNANRTFDFYGQLDLLQVVLMPDTAVGIFLERWAAIYGKQRLAATKSTGNIVAGGTPTSNIPIATLFSASNGLIYESTSSVTIITNTPGVVSINRSGNVATVITTAEHDLATNIPFTMTGATQPEYNVIDQDILQVIDANTFTYEVSGTPASPATGSPVVTYDSILVPITSQDFQDSENGVEVNLAVGSNLSLQSPIVGVDNTSTVGAVPIGGGSDQETDAQLRIRLLEKMQNPVSHFSISDITEKAKEIAGVTRVFVEEVTPAVGQVTVYFMRDNDTDPIPDAGEVTTVKTRLLTIKPANTATADLIVAAPSEVATAFTFSAMTPNTTSMQTAVTANLQQFFAEETEIGVNIQEDAYRAAIQNTIDTETGNTITDFTLSVPSGDIVIASGSIGTLGVITYP